MNVKKSLETFKELHALINGFLSKLPADNARISSLVEEINGHQQRYYEDLIKELNMDENKKVTLKKLWDDVMDEESGKGQQQAA